MLFRDEKIEGKFLKIAQEHETVLSHLKTIEQILNDKAGLSRLKTFLPVFTRDMHHHFKVEEQFLFPAALLSMPEIELVDLITAMVKEHGCVERDLSTLKFLIENSDDENSLSDPVIALLTRMHKDVHRHAKIEIEQIFPKMDKNKRCRKLIKGILIA